MSALSAAKTALVQARNELSNLGSSNIIQGGTGFQKNDGIGVGQTGTVSQKDIEFMERKLNLDMAFSKLVPSRLGTQNSGMNKFIAHGETARRVGAGNCQEYAACACAALNSLDTPPQFDAVYLEGGNHIFVAIGQEPDDNGVFPKDFSTWNSGAAICDPWANLAVSARSYPSAWKERLRGWNNLGIMLKGENNDVRKPTHTSWYDAPVNSRKLSYTRVEPDTSCWSCFKCFITTATCMTNGLGDDCYELTLLRWFRDEILLTSDQWKNDVHTYYDIAPRIVAAISQHKNNKEIYKSIYVLHLQPAIKAIENREYELAHRLYKEMVNNLQHRFM